MRLPQQSLRSDALLLGVLVQLSAVRPLPVTQGVHGSVTLCEDGGSMTTEFFGAVGEFELTDNTDKLASLS